MKIWNTVAQNVISGCIGGLLVMSAAQAQKPGSTPAQHEIRTHKLVLVDEKDKDCGELNASGGSAVLRLKSGLSSVAVTASDEFGSNIILKEKNQHFVLIDASELKSVVSAGSGMDGYNASLSASKIEAGVLVAKFDSSQVFSASVDEKRSNVMAMGPQSSFSVGDQNRRTLGSLDWGVYPDKASMTLKDGTDHKYWSQPSLKSNNQ